jgi:tetratricopeptide (TPR) repeat protein
MRFEASAAAALTMLAVILWPGRALGALGANHQAAESGQILLQAFPPGCSVEVDTRLQGKTDAQGGLTLAEVDTGDHYLHVDCPGQTEQELFISIKAGERLEVNPKPPASPLSAFDAAQARDRLRDLVQQAVQARAAGHSDEAIAGLRRAVQLDPTNADLHVELGITFLLLKDWKRARVEYLEAIKHDPGEAESHNGLGYALEKLGGIDVATAEYRTAMRLDPDDGEYREHYFKALAELEGEKDKGKNK